VSVRSIDRSYAHYVLLLSLPAGDIYDRGGHERAGRQRSTSCAVSWPPCFHYWIGTNDLPLTFSQFLTLTLRDLVKVVKSNIPII
jgi:hypothetical protein